MRIAVAADVFSAIELGTGLERYTRELIAGLSKTYDTELIGWERSSALRELAVHTVLMPRELLKRESSVDLFHAFAPVDALCFPLLRKPTVVSYHDLATLLYKKGNSWHVRLTAPYFYKVGKYCSRVLAASIQTRQELIDYLHFPPEKIRVVNLGVAEKFVPQARDERTPLVIGFIGKLDARKRVDYLIMAFHYLKKRCPALRVALRICSQGGSEYGTLIKLVEGLGLTSAIEFHGGIPEEAIVDFYNSLDVLAVPSEWEGFGLPILEAQRCGVPVVIRADAHIPDEVRMCCAKATSEQNMAEIFYRILSEDSLRQRIIHAASEYSKCFTWEKTVHETLKVYDELI